MSTEESLFKQPATEPAPESPADLPSPRPAADEDARVSALQRQLSNLMILFIVLSGTLAVFLLQQVRHTRADLRQATSQPQQVEQMRLMVDNYNSKTVPGFQNFVGQLAKYSESHPDILPILARYGLIQRNPAPTDTPPAPAP